MRNTKSTSHLGNVPPAAGVIKPARIEASPFVLGNPKLIPRRQFAYGTHYIRRFISATVGPGGLGKTSLTTVEALAMVTGRPLLGIKCEPRIVWIFNLEDPLEEMHRRIAAACIQFGITDAELAGRLYVDSGRDRPLALATQGPAGIVVTPHARELTDEIIRRGIDVLIVDPFIQSHEVNENDNTGIALVARTWAQIANDGNCSIDLSHHVRKTGGGDPSIEDARGAKALIDAARAARRLVRMTETEAASAGIEVTEAWRYSREGDGKENLAPPNRAKSWRKLVSVDLDNGDANHEGDSIGVMTPWQWPDSFADVTSDHLTTARRLAAETKYRADPQSTEWFGRVVAEILDLDPADKAVREKVKHVISTWIASNEFEVYDDVTDARKVKKFIRPSAYKSAPPAHH